MARKDKDPPKLMLVANETAPKRRTPRGPKPLEFVNAVENVIDGRVVHLVNARDLHYFLGSRRQYANWLDDRTSALKLQEGADIFQSGSEGVFNADVKNPPSGQSTTGAGGRGGRPRSRDSFVTLDVAKAIAMTDEGERGEMVRAYFIELEKRYFKEQQDRLRQSLEAESRDLLRKSEEIHALRMEEAVDRARRDQAIITAEGDRRINLIIAAEVERRLEEERQIKRNRAIEQRRHHRLTSLNRYYQDLGVDAGTAVRITFAALNHLMASGLQDMAPIAEDAITKEALFDHDDIEQWRHRQGYLVEREFGISIRAPAYGHPFWRDALLDPKVSETLNPGRETVGHGSLASKPDSARLSPWLPKATSKSPSPCCARRTRRSSRRSSNARTSRSGRPTSRWRATSTGSPAAPGGPGCCPKRWASRSPTTGG